MKLKKGDVVVIVKYKEDGRFKSAKDVNNKEIKSLMLNKDRLIIDTTKGDDKEYPIKIFKYADGEYIKNKYSSYDFMKEELQLAKINNWKKIIIGGGG
jgi:hypothetical protein